MTYVVDKLEKRGLLERVFCEEDQADDIYVDYTCGY